MKVEIQRIKPFSNGTEHMCWMDANCWDCVKSFKPTNGEMPDFGVTQKLVNLGRECKMKFALDKGMYDGSIDVDNARPIGWNEDKGWPDSCMMFSGDDNDEWKPSPRKPYGPDEQLCLPYLINDIVMNEVKELETV